LTGRDLRRRECFVVLRVVLYYFPRIAAGFLSFPQFSLRETEYLFIARILFFLKTTLATLVFACCFCIAVWSQNVDIAIVIKDLGILSR
jgi:hypothetical protein